MPLNEETFKMLSEEEQDFYTTNDAGEYVLDTAKIDPGDELKGALQKERQARKEAERAAKDLRTKQEQLENKSLEEQEKYKELWEKSENEKKQLSEKNKNILLDMEINNVITRLTKDQKKAKLLKNELKGNFEFAEDGSIKIVGIAGDTAEQLANHYKDEFPYLTDESQAKGGDSTGNKGKGVAENVKTQTEIDSLTPAEKMKFFTSGGRVKTE